ncbi:hypothetical protein BCL90_3808 [Pedobacter alluvionis]|uniref:Uncharacterized protein n=1 Tax=Pedobacter alluvionis TaxID=475253 RepID=A0A497XVS0_9SPHI|nr:hypothetical protein BCL90_3808 [Pedobacter alluvionis]
MFFINSKCLQPRCIRSDIFELLYLLQHVPRDSRGDAGSVDVKIIMKNIIVTFQIKINSFQTDGSTKF